MPMSKISNSISYALQAQCTNHHTCVPAMSMQQLRPQQGEYYGTKAALNVYGLPTIKNIQSSSLEIWVANFSRHQVNIIRVGWHVSPDQYGDNETHFFVDWFLDKDFKTACMNFECKGFIHVNTSQLVPGYRLQPLSKYNGEQRYISLRIAKCKKYCLLKLLARRKCLVIFISRSNCDSFHPLANCSNEMPNIEVHISNIFLDTSAYSFP